MKIRAEMTREHITKINTAFFNITSAPTTISNKQTTDTSIIGGIVVSIQNMVLKGDLLYPVGSNYPAFLASLSLKPANLTLILN